VSAKRKTGEDTLGEEDRLFFWAAKKKKAWGVCGCGDGVQRRYERAMGEGGLGEGFPSGIGI